MSRKYFIYGAFGLLLAIVLVVWICDQKIKKEAEPYLYESVDSIPYNKVGLLLGTSRIARSGRINLYYKYRIEAAVELFNARKIDYIIVSGDNSRVGYDEPTDMMNDLVAAGVPQERVVLDYAGFRTLDSVVRCQTIFGQRKITIISQKFHNERALYLAQKNNMEAIAFSVQDVNRMYSLKTQLRERLARVKVFIDLLLDKKPKFGGEKITIGD